MCVHESVHVGMHSVCVWGGGMVQRVEAKLWECTVSSSYDKRVLYSLDGYFSQ